MSEESRVTYNIEKKVEFLIKNILLCYNQSIKHAILLIVCVFHREG